MNELNLRMKKAVESYCHKNNLTIISEDYGKFFYRAFINDDLRITCNIMENITSNRNLPSFYMKKIMNGKQKRIPKIEWI